MTVEHKTIVNADLHEPKDVSAAGVNTLYTANGTGSGAWSKVTDVVIKGISALTANSFLISDGAGGFSSFVLSNGLFTFNNIATPNVVTFPSVYTKIAPTTVAGGFGVEFTEATTARLTYTGAAIKHTIVSVNVSFDQSVGANRDFRFAVFKNGTIISHSEIIRSTVSGNKGHVALNAYVNLVTDDFLELFVRNEGGSGDVNIYTLTFHAVGTPG